MLGERLTAARWVVSLEDPALVPILRDDPAAVGKYSRTRDIADLGGVERLEQLPKPPTLVKLAPMLVKYQHLENNPEYLLAFHAQEFKNAPDAFADWEDISGDRCLTQAAVNAIPRAVVREWADVVLQLASADGVTTPFGAPDGWLDRMQRRVALLALDAAVGTTV